MGSANLALKLVVSLVENIGKCEYIVVIEVMLSTFCL
jgi:hypothetical protein